jgi:hypothetical protein
MTFQGTFRLWKRGVQKKTRRKNKNASFVTPLSDQLSGFKEKCFWSTDILHDSLAYCGSENCFTV